MMIQKAAGRLTSALLLTLALARAQAATLYVSTQGSDSNPGTSAQPLRTITRAYSLASAGTTILVSPGVYTDYQSGWGLHLGKSGTASSPIVLRSQVRGGAVIDGQNASDRNQAIYIDGNYNIVDGFQIRNGPLGGIAVYGSGNQILDNEIHHNGNPASTSSDGRDGVYEGQSTSGNVYANNYIHDNGRTGGSNLDHGLYLCGQNQIVCNNVSIRNDGSGLQIAGYTAVRNMKVYNNVFAWNGTEGIIVWMAMDGVDIKNNICYRNGLYGIYFYAATGSGVVMDHNLVYGNGAGNYSSFSNGGSTASYTLGTSISSEPLFVNSSSSGLDPHLTAGSPAVGAGYNLSSTFTADMDGVVRAASGAWDLGAYSYGAAADTTPPTVSIASPANNVTVFGSAVTVSANASDNVGVAGVQFKLDGANLGAEDTSAPYSAVWNTTLSANGSHTLSAVARDAAGNQTTASAVPVLVNNVNTAPSISSLADQTATVGIAIGPLAFTVSDAETAAGSLSVSGSSSNPTLVPNAAIVFGGSGANRTVTLTPALSQTGTATITVTVSDGQLAKSTTFRVTVNALPLDNGLTFASTSGAITAPFVVGNGVISQPAYTGVTAGGRAAYTFTISAAGDYTVSALVNAPDDGANSFFVNIDAEPTDPTMIWDVPVTSGLTAQTVSWRGNGGVDANSASGMSAQFAPKVFTISAGTHQLIVRGREGNVQLGTITIAAAAGKPAPTVSITEPADGTTVSGSGITVLADATSTLGIAGVQFKLDGANIGPVFTNQPYGGPWNSTTVPDGSHSFIAVATDTAGNQTASAPVTVLVSNTVAQSALPDVTIAATDPDASRIGPDNGAFNVTRAGSTASALTVNYSLGGTAINGTDYNALGTSVTIPAGATSATITVTPKPSGSYVGPESVILTLAANPAYTVGSGNSATVGIAGNGVPITSLRKVPGGGMRITWTSVAGKVYRIAYKDNLNDPWGDLGASIAATGSSASWTDTSSGASKQRYYVAYMTN